MKFLSKVTLLIALVFFVSSCQYLMENPLNDGKFSTSPRPGKNIVDVVVEESDLSALEAAVIQADLAGALQGEGPFTVFAPTDEAFEAAGIDLGTVSKETLTNILQYHVVAAGLLTANIKDQPYETLNGQEVFINKEYKNVFINGNVEVVEANIIATNGIIHKINKVLMPPAGDIVDVAVSQNPDQFNALVAAVIQAGLDDDLKGEGPFTVFAPTDEAFNNLLSDLGISLDQVPLQTLVNILTYHVVPDRIFSTDLKSQNYNTLNGQAIKIDLENGVTINEDVNVIATDFLATNGVIHVIDKVLMPVDKDIVELAIETPEFSTLVAALQAADLVSALQADGPFTVFAPTNEAFDNLPDGVLDELLKPENKDALKNILLYHVVDVKILSTDLSRGSNKVTALNEDKFRVFNLPHVPLFIKDANPQSSNSKIVAKDIMAANGVIHAIDEVLLPRDLGL